MRGGAEHALTKVIERLPQCDATAFLCHEQIAPVVACELSFLELPSAGQMSSAARQSNRDTDEQLMCRAKRDDVDAFAGLVNRHLARAFSVAYATCPDAGRAEDAVQEAFLAIWRSRATYESTSGSFTAWAMKIVRHRAIDMNRHESSRPKLATISVDASDAATPALSDAVIASEDTRALLAALGRLPEAQTEVIALAFFGQLSHAEIARALGLPPGTIKSRMRLGLSKLRRELEPSRRLSESVPGTERSRDGIA